MAVAAIVHYTLSDIPYALWVRGELADEINLPKDGSRVEVIRGEIVVSPAPVFRHNRIATAIGHAMSVATVADPGFRWVFVQANELNLVPVKDGCIPDLIIIDRDVAEKVDDEDRRQVLPEEVAAVVEITSPTNAGNDRPPRLVQVLGTKRSAYAKSAVPFYLLVDRDPRMPGVTLYGEPDVQAGTYEPLHTWKFGEVVKLPAPLGFEIDTERWKPWTE
ncbi:Uma2 family endonuclease [Actinomadura sp. NAK00032]|uniref:Uma2 family endonuclease n=1 Tax=Actinomadura sp. NAK00032 TaxID=2742128 RepID=UPI001590171D|nr:Uma2 family endonuclease [Actinomadura sp. NAK00032]QKW38965.1 Uma2 family endonuclease [Actinomadura sp. NAK00032]